MYDRESTLRVTTTLPARPVPSVIARVWIGLLCALALLVALPRNASADSMALSIAPSPVQELTSQITYSGFAEEGRFPVLAANNPGVPCAANPAADNGTTLTGTHFLEGGAIGAISGSVNYTPPSTGAFTICGWLEIPAGLLETDGGPITAATSLPLEVRAPVISLALHFPRRPEPRRPFALNLLATSEVRREVVVEGFPLTKRGCPVDYTASPAAHLIDAEVTGGPWRESTNVKGLAAGSYIFCAWADASEDGGLYPDAAGSVVLHLGSPTPKRHRPPRPRHR
jgi:hypothetical protein